MTTRRRRVLAAAAILFPALALSVGPLAPPSQSIVGGTRAKAVAPHDGSFQRVDSPRSDNHVCGATLIAPRWAITAGHCLVFADTESSLAETGNTEIALSGNPVGWKVRLGSTRVGSGGRLVAVKQFVRASRFVAPEGDIGLLKLSRPVNARPAVLATRTPAPGTRARIGGWGWTGRGSLRDYDSPRSYPGSMRTATTDVAPRQACGLEPGQAALCIGVGSRVGPDNMDSGGPVYVQQDGRTVLAGTVNGGNYIDGTRPSIYTDLSVHRRWIRAYTSGRRSIPGPEPTTTPGLAGSGQINPSGCAVSVVRVAASRPTDPAMLLTNGHCADRRPKPGRALVDRPARHLVNLLGADSNPVTRATTTRLLYATMTGTDVAVYRLRQTYAELEALGVPARLLATAGPRPGDALLMLSGSRQATFACTVEAIAAEVREAGYTQRDAVRYASARSCRPDAGTSGSSLVNRTTGEIVAVHNSHVAGEGKPCTEDNPCEVGPDGTTSAVKGRAYAQQVAGLTACLGAGSVFATGQPGCTLPAR